MIPKFAASTILLALVPLAWLVHRHQLPWPTAWADGLALALVAFSGACSSGDGRLPRPWAAFAAIALAAVAVQATSGRIFFLGDALMASMYLAAFMLAMVLGARTVGQDRILGLSAYELIAATSAMCAVLSVGLALVQWFQLELLGAWLIPLAEHGRPFANLAQPNHFSTVCFIGIVGLALLRQNGRLGSLSFWIAASWLLFGMAMSSSRTGWVQLGVMLLFTFIISRRAKSAIPTIGLGALVTGFAWVVYNWSELNKWLLLSAGLERPAALEGGTRGQHWRTLLDGLTVEPWWGYGWQQVSVAQSRMADRHPFVGEPIASSHNTLVDLLVWNGIPIGSVLILLALWWFVSRLVRCRDPVSMWLLIGVAGLAVHGMFELPLEYAYFLLPLGLWIGAIERLQDAARPHLDVSSAFVRVWAVLLGIGLGLIGLDYAKAERAIQAVQISSGVSMPGAGAALPPPKMYVLDQLAARIRFAQVVAQPGLSDTEVDWLLRVAERYNLAPMMFRYALVAGLNGRDAHSALTLVRLCRIHRRTVCDASRQEWQDLQKRYPTLGDFPTL